MKPYFFGYAFVRLSKLLAIVIATLGILASFGWIWQAFLEGESLRYQPSSELRRSVAQLPEEYAMTARFLTEHGVDVGSTSVGPRLTSDVRSGSDLRQLKDQLDQMRGASEQLKVKVLGGVDQAIRQIEDQLRIHAASIRSEEPPSRTATPEATSPPRTPSEQQPIVLYGTDVDESDLEQRSSTVRGAKEFFDVMVGNVEKPENKKLFGDLNQSLDSLLQLLTKSAIPIKQEEPPRRDAGPSPPAPRTFNAEKIAAQLESIRGALRSAVLSSWLLDEALDKAADVVDGETQRQHLAVIAIKKTWLRMGSLAGLTLLASVFSAFLILVTADLIQTLLDTATNTRIIAEK